MSTSTRGSARSAPRAGGALALGVLALGMLGSGLGAAWAGDEAAQGGGAVPAPLDEVIVQARRREERLADVPLAESVQSGAELQAQSAVLFEDVARSAPNVLAFRSARSVSALEVTMRGQTAVPSSIVYDPAVGLYIDGVYVANGQAAMGTLLDIDQVEITRGAQGTLSGRNNTGGSISIHTQRPQLDAYSADLAVSGGSKSLFGGRAVVNLPLGGQFALRVAFQENQHDGWGSSDATGQQNLMNQHRNQLRVGGLWAPAPSTDVYFTYERFRASEVGALLHPLPGTILASLPPDTVPTDFYQTDTGTVQSDVAQSDAYQLTLTQHFSAQFNAKLIVAYRQLQDVNNYDADAHVLSVADVALSSTSYQRSAELQFSGLSPSAALDWVGGLYWFHDQGSSDSNLAPVSIAPPPASMANTLELNSVHNRSTAGFLHGELHLNRAWSVAAGVRRTADERTVDDNAFWLNAPGLGPQFCTILDSASGFPLGALSPTGACPAIHNAVSYGYWSWELASHYRFNDQLMAYVRSGRAQRSGGWNIPVATNQDSPFRPEQLTDVELGVKGNSGDGQLGWNLALFSGQYEQMQRLLATLVGSTPVTSVINAGKARVSGLEFEAQAQLTRRFGLHAALGYTNASYQRFLAPDGSDLSHNQFYMTPRYQGSVSGTYEAPLGAVGRLRLRLDYAWHSAVQFNVINDFNAQGAVGVLNGRVTYSAAGSGFEVALFGTNLTDRAYAYNGGTIVQPLQGPLASWQAAADRRLVGVEVSYQVRHRS